MERTLNIKVGNTNVTKVVEKIFLIELKNRSEKLTVMQNKNRLRNEREGRYSSSMTFQKKLHRYKGKFLQELERNNGKIVLMGGRSISR